MLKIRREEESDYPAVFEVNRQAFERLDEAELVEALRGVADPMVSLVAELDGVLAGHILFTPVQIPGDEEPGRMMALAPMAVHPVYQNQGIGSRLVREGLGRCREMGQVAVFVLGHPNYYPRFGFQPAGSMGFHYQGPEFQGSEFDPYFFVLPFEEDVLKTLSGNVQFLPPFDEI